jgi:ferritin-like metal-binding protein YciE
MPSLRSPDDMLANELKQIHTAERQLMRALPKLAKSVNSESLRDMLDRRREEGGRLIEELEGAMEEIGLRAGRAQNPAIEGLIEGAAQHSEDLEDESMRDAALVGEIQKIEHYCIAAWGTSKALAGLLDHQTIVQAMERALAEGKRFDEEMTELAESEINPQMLSAESGTEEEESESGRGRKRGGRSAGARTQRASAGRSAGAKSARARGSAGGRSGGARKAKAGRGKRS